MSGRRSDNSSASHFGNIRIPDRLRQRNPKRSPKQLPTSDLVQTITPLELQFYPGSTMRNPTVFDRVRVSGRDGEFIIVRVDQPACIVDLCSALDGTAIDTNVPFSLVSYSSGLDPATAGSQIEYEASKTNNILDSCYANLCASREAARASRSTTAELSELVCETLQIIRATQICIIESDKIIARNQFGDPSAQPEEDFIP